MMLDAFEDGRPRIRREGSSSNLSTRSRRMRTLVGLACVALLAAFIPSRWGLRVAIVVALLVFGTVWLLATGLGFMWDFYWPAKQHSPR